MRMERGEGRHTASVYGNISKKFFFANSEAQEGSSPGAPALHSVPVGPSIVRPAWTLGPCLCHMVWGTLLTSGRTSVAMSFLCISICDPVDPESLFQSFPLTRWWSQLKTAYSIYCPGIHISWNIWDLSAPHSKVQNQGREKRERNW